MVGSKRASPHSSDIPWSRIALERSPASSRWIRPPIEISAGIGSDMGVSLNCWLHVLKRFQQTVLTVAVMGDVGQVVEQPLQAFQQADLLRREPDVFG